MVNSMAAQAILTVDLPLTYNYEYENMDTSISDVIELSHVGNGGLFMAERNSKLKLLYLMEILLNKTDETHTLTMQEILTELRKRGIEAERKSIYSDLDQLKDYGIDIDMYQQNKNYHYHVISRQFELAELKLLVDSVQSARFITEKKSNALIKKIETLASEYEAKELQHQVFVTERVKSMNEKILYNIDSIHKAISSNSKITFQYFNWDVDKKEVLRHDGKIYEQSPWAMTLAEENYYLVCFDSQNKEGIKYFRVDKMKNIKVTDEPREGKEEFRNFDIAEYAKKRFRMYDGDEMNVSLLCKNEFAGVIIDRFGKDVMMHPVDKEHFKVVVKVAVSKQFYAWVMAMGEGVEIVGPDEVVEQVRQMLKELTKQYK